MCFIRTQAMKQNKDGEKMGLPGNKRNVMAGRELEWKGPRNYSVLDNVEGRFVDSTIKLSEKMKLECMYPKKAVIIQTSWMKHNGSHKENVAVLHPIYGIHIEDKYRGRIYFENTSREDQSLSFNKSTLEDVGLYCCSIVTYPDGVSEKVIEVIHPADAFEISERQNNPVFAKPGGSVTFICPYDIGGLVQQVKWERIKAGGTDTIVLCTSVGGRSFGSDFKNRALVDCSGQASSTVVIQNITASDYTTYRCVATGRNKTFEMSFTVVAGGTSAAVLLFVFLLIFCITTAYRKKSSFDVSPDHYKRMLISCTLWSELRGRSTGYYLYQWTRRRGRGSQRPYLMLCILLRMSLVTIMQNTIIIPHGT
uniref:CD226 molecule n=1 Tax=Gallus gallus TaxID=9031 RepID=A0A8V0X9K6_CHICK